MARRRGGCNKPRRSERRTQAIERQSAYDALSADEKLDRAGNRQRLRLLAAADAKRVKEVRRVERIAAMRTDDAEVMAA